MALRCPFLTKLPMNLIKSQPAAVLKFAEACPFATANLNLNILKSFSNVSSTTTIGGKAETGVGAETGAAAETDATPEARLGEGDAVRKAALTNADVNNNMNNNLSSNNISSNNNNNNLLQNHCKNAFNNISTIEASKSEKPSLKSKAVGCPGSSFTSSSALKGAHNSFHTVTAESIVSNHATAAHDLDVDSLTPAKSAAAKCPFLAQNQMLQSITEASEGVQDDVIEIGSQAKKTEIKEDDAFNYEEYCKDELEKKKREGTYRVFPRVDRKAMQFPYARDKVLDADITVWCSNDYLGMSRHPKVMNAVKDAVDRFGVGAGGTRNIGGNSSLHESLEGQLAELHGKERALVFSSCFIANDTALETLGSKLPGCHIFSDSGNHASMIKGIRNSRAPKHIFRHNDPEHLDQLLSQVDKKVPKIVAFETVHSMTGAVCPLQELIDVSKAHGAITFVDEVHAVGLYGKHGAGIAEREGLMDQVDIFSGTLGKAYGNVGGYIAGSDAVIDLVRSFGSGFIFTTSLPPHVLAGAKEAVRILASEEGRALRRRHQDTVSVLRSRLVDAGLPVIHCPSHIIPIHVGDPVLSTKAMYDLRHRWNIYIQAINYPTVKFGEERLRLAPSPYHDQDMMNYFVDAIKDVWKRNGLPFKSMCSISCSFCQEPLKFEALASREYPCDGSRCCHLLLDDAASSGGGGGCGKSAVDRKAG